MKKEMNEDLVNYTMQMAKQHVQVSEGEAPEDETDLENQVDDMWYSFAIPDFENNPAFDGLNIMTLIKTQNIQALYKDEVTKGLKKRYKMK